MHNTTRQQYTGSCIKNLITSVIDNMREHCFKVVEGKQKLINFKEVISECCSVCSISKQNQMRTMNSQDSNAVNNFNWASTSLFFIALVCLHNNIKYMLYKYIWFCYKPIDKVTLCLLLRSTCRIIFQTYKSIWLLEFLMSLTELVQKLWLQKRV